jgi:hypothetical protein
LTGLTKGEIKLKTYGYDLLIQVDERLLNKALSALFYTGMLKVSGTYAFVKGVPDTLLGFTEVKYRIRLRNEPYLDFKGKDAAGIRMSVEVVLVVLSGVNVEVDVDFGASAEVRFDLASSKIIYDLTNTGIYDLTINDRLQFHQNALDRLNEILGIVLKQYMSSGVKEIELPISLQNVALPTVPDTPENRLPISKVEVAILDKRLVVVGADFFDHNGGSFTMMQDMTQGSELFVALQTDAMRQIAQFWWERTQLDKTITFQGSLPVNARKTFAKGMDLFLRGITLGFLQPETEVIKSDLVYDGAVTLLALPDMEFLSGDRAQIRNLKLKVVVHARLDTETRRTLLADTSGFIPDSITPWQDDIKLSERTKNESLFPTEEDLSVEVEVASCIIDVDEQSRLIVKVKEADLELDFGNQWYQNLTDRVTNAFLDLLEKKIVSYIPQIVVSPSLLLSDAKVMGYTFGVDIKSLELVPEELVLCSNLTVKELTEGAIAVPLYIANKKSMKLHRYDCAVVEDIDFTHRLGYHSVSEAMKNGYKPCRECLRGYTQDN